MARRRDVRSRAIVEIKSGVLSWVKKKGSLRSPFKVYDGDNSIGIEGASQVDAVGMAIDENRISMASVCINVSMGQMGCRL